MVGGLTWDVPVLNDPAAGVEAHSEKQDAAATWMKAFGHPSLMGCVDHGSGGSGWPAC